ncbi:MAG: trimeric intracellular cation channel family protein [Thermomicrobiales bacterium]|nr:trimeric intracellular cation channel family protein [Thermomicrobiales bacterium]
MFDSDTAFLIVDIFGIFVGAATGALTGIKLRYDIMGIWFLALVTGLGGGIIRDTMLQIGPPLALTNPFYLPTVMAATIIVAIWGRHIGQLRKTITTLDAIALANFAVAGTLRSVDADLSYWAAVLLGIMTAVGGGIMRDMMIGTSPAIFHRAELYGLAALGSCLSVLLLYWLGLGRELTIVASVGVGVFLRLGSLRWGWMSWEPRQI